MDEKERLYQEKIKQRVALENSRENLKKKKALPKLKIFNATDIQKEIERRMQAISDENILAYLNESTLGDAKLYQVLHNDFVIYVKFWNRFLIWAGNHWAEDDNNLQYSYIENVCQCYQRVADNKKELLEKERNKDVQESLIKILDSIERRVKQLRTPRGGEAVLTMVQRLESPMLCLPKQIDKHYYKLACPNGVVDIRTGDISPGNPKDLLLKACITPYNKELLELADPCPETTAFLLRSMDGDEELVSFIWRILGYGIIRDRKDHIFTIFWGEHGRNGKDTLIKLITKTLGLDLSGDIPVEMFLQTTQVRNSSAPSPDILALRGMCIGWVNEAEEGQRFALAKLKKLTGGGYITARGLQDKEQTTWLQTHLPIMTTNELPKAKADDAAFWQRTIIVKWLLSFVDEPKEPYQRQADKKLDQKLEKEAEGVLVRLIQGAMDYLQNGLNIPAKVHEWTNGQKMKWDDLAQFIEECCEIEPYQEDPGNYKWKTPASDLHEYFVLWYAKNKDNREKAKISSKLFSQLLDKKNIPSIRSNGSKRLGIKLKFECEKELNNYRNSKNASSFPF